MKCAHRWIMRVSQDGLLYIRFCGGCRRAEYLDQDGAWSTMRYAAGLPKMKAALTVIPGTGEHVGTGTHDYPGTKNPEGFFTSDCAHGCGCWMGGSRSGGPPGVDAFGECPKAPAAKKTEKTDR